MTNPGESVDASQVPQFADSLIALGGEAGRLIAAHDWSATPLGPIEAWPQSLRTTLGMLVVSPVPIALLWGEDGIMLYNDGYAAIAGARHPHILGMRVRESWPEIAEFSETVMRVGLAGSSLAYHDQELTLHRNGAPERVWFDLYYSPVLDEGGRPAGVIAIVVETTARVVAAGRQSFRVALDERLRKLDDPHAVTVAASEALGRHLGVHRAGYTEMTGDDGYGRIFGEWLAETARPLAAEYRLAEFGTDFLLDYVAGRSVVVEDFATDPRPAASVSAAAHAALEIRAKIVVPLLKAGHLAALFWVHAAAPRRWTEDELGLVTEVAERTWEASERARAETALRQSEARRGTALAVARLGTFDWDLRTGRVMLDQRGQDIFGFGPSEATRAEEILARVEPGDRIPLRAAIERAVSSLSQFEIDYRIRLPDGTVRVLSSVTDPVRIGEDGSVRLVGVVVDITEQHDAAVALQNSEEQLRLATEAAEIGLWDMDLVADNLYWPPRVKAMFGISPDVPITLDDYRSGVHPDDRARVAEAFDAALDPTGRALYDVEFRTVGKEDGVVRWVAAKGRGVFEQDRCVRVIGTALDITRRKADEERLRELNDTLERLVAEAVADRSLLAELIEHADVLVQVVDQEFRWLALNQSAAREFSRVFGVREPLVGECMLDLLAEQPQHRDAMQAIWARALGGEEFVEIASFGDPAVNRRAYEMRFRTLRDREGTAVGAYQFVYDVTDRLAEQARLREAEAALQQSQKMEAVGQLTGGIAHDFNNLLQGVAGSLDLIRRKPGDSERVRLWAEHGLLAAERGAKLTGQLLAFSRLQRIEAKPLVVADLVSGMRNLLERTLGPAVTVQLELDEGRASVLSDPTQLELAVLNLAINARDAMTEGGELHIATRSVRLESEPELEPGAYVELSVRDSGAGMPPEVAARAFDPFYTTKEVGKGTGLGLSQVYGIARQAGGTARIDSRVGRGTTVRLYLRQTEGHVAEPQQPNSDDPACASPRSARVLVVDDDPDVRRFLVDSLSVLGYAVEDAGDVDAGSAALERIRPDVLVLDYAMPGMNGAQFALVARQRLPDLPIIFASGYADTAAIEAVAGPGTQVLRKPFRIAELEAAVASALAW